MEVGDTQASSLLEQLLALQDGDLRATLGIAQEYQDHPSIAGKTGIPAGNRLMMQLRMALDELGFMEGIVSDCCHSMVRTTTFNHREAKFCHQCGHKCNTIAAHVRRVAT
jgi:hypothetical protein